MAIPKIQRWFPKKEIERMPQVDEFWQTHVDNPFEEAATVVIKELRQNYKGKWYVLHQCLHPYEHMTISTAVQDFCKQYHRMELPK